MKDLIHTASKGDTTKIAAIMAELQRDMPGYAQHALKYFLSECLAGNYPRLSMDKYSSNLIEFAIQKADDALQAAIVQELLA